MEEEEESDMGDGFYDYDFGFDEEENDNDTVMEIIGSDDYELEALMEEREALAAMITEGKFAKAVDKIKSERGESGVMELVFAIEKATGWHMEIVASKSDVEDALFNWYGTYDDMAWMKARNTDAWERLTADVNFVSRRALSEVVTEVAGDRKDSDKAFVRRWLFDLWKKIDIRLS